MGYPRYVQSSEDFPVSTAAEFRLWEEVLVARDAAHHKHGEHSIELVPGDDFTRWLPILIEEAGEVAHALTYDALKDSYLQLPTERAQMPHRLAALRAELIDVLAVASAWVDAIDRLP